MSKLKLAALPNTTPVKLTVTFPPDIHDALKDYARVYEQTYGTKVSVVCLVPYIVDSFLGSDAIFKKARRELPNVSSLLRPPN